MSVRQEVLVVVYRSEREFLVLLRSPARQGYWHLIAGGVEAGETPEQAAVRELAEEAGPLRLLRFAAVPLELAYEAPRGRVTVHGFSAEAPPGWEPVLNEEHVEYRWCSLAEAERLLAYPEPRKAVAWVANSLKGRPMRIAFDTSPLVQTRAGTARHVRGLLRALRDRPGLELELLAFGGGGRVASVVRDALWYPLGLPRRARRYDLLHCPTFRGPLRAPAPVVLTVHDLAILRYPDAFPRWHRLYGKAGLRRVLQAADAVVAVSEFTKAETEALAGVPAERIRVVPNGVDTVFTPDGPAAEGSYVLAVATLEPRKNLGRAVEAARLAGLELRVVGARGWGGVEVPGWVGEIPDSELAALYRGARCVLYPSLYEGFGLPVLEAMACGTPVVTSRGTAMEEVASGSAIFADPLDPASLAAGIAEAQARRDELVPLGFARARELTWERAADAVEALWRELA